jgi:hypothetical protein
MLCGKLGRVPADMRHLVCAETGLVPARSRGTLISDLLRGELRNCMSDTYWVREDRLGHALVERQPWLPEFGVYEADLQAHISSRGRDLQLEVGNLERKPAGRGSEAWTWSRENALPVGNEPLLDFQRLLDRHLPLVRGTLHDEFGGTQVYRDAIWDYDGAPPSPTTAQPAPHARPPHYARACQMGVVGMTPRPGPAAATSSSGWS